MSEQSPGRVLGRRRRANVEGGRRERHVVRVTAEEELRLTVRANEQGITVPRLLVEAALADRMAGLTSTERREAIAELFAVRRLLAGVANNLNQVARVANVTDELPDNAAVSIDAIRRMVPRIEAAVEGLIEP